MNENSEIKIKVLPLWLKVPNKVLNSVCKVLIILIQININRDGINQKEIGIISNPKNVLIQFNDKLKILVDGSNVENKLVIIFNI